MLQHRPGHGAVVTIRKVGVEEELMLVDPDTHKLTALAAHAVREHDGTDVEKELFLQMLETATEPAVTAEDLARILRAGRRAVGESAAGAGGRAVAMALPVLADETLDVTPDPRYRRIRDDFGELTAQSLACGMHVHVDVDGDEEAVAVADRVRPWLPVLLALSANSPYWRGRDTGHASWRSQIITHWPTGGPSDAFGDPAGYRRTVERVQAWGAALDPGMLYLDIRLAERYPTLEFRVSDVCAEVEDAVLVAVLARALVETEARSWDEGVTAESWRVDELKVMSWRAARYGLPGPLVHPGTLALAPARDVVTALFAHVRQALEDAGEDGLVRDLFEQMLARGNGAVLQRSVHEATGSLERVVADLADRTEASWRA